MNTLDQWETEAKKSQTGTYTMDFSHEPAELRYAERILALIDLARKKDEALKDVSKDLDEYIEDNLMLDMKQRLNRALALTEQLK